MVTCDVVKSAGHEVTPAADGAEGLRLQQEKSFDLVITDLFMPVKEGVETISDIKKDFPNVKIIAMSGRSFQGHNYLPIAEALGVQVILNKPIPPADLIKAIDDLLKENKTSAT